MQRTGGSGQGPAPQGDGRGDGAQNAGGDRASSKNGHTGNYRQQMLGK
jgi:hypothetical protein